MARLRTETAPEITVNDESVVFKAATGATAPLVEFKNSSGTVVGNIAANGVMNVASVVASNAGTGSTALATRAYVDQIAAGVNWHSAVVAATTAALPTCTYNNGTDGVGATLTATANAVLTIDTMETVNTYSYLIKNQANAAHNGIYTVTEKGSGSAPFVLTRREDSDNNPAGEVREGDAVFSLYGNANVNMGFILRVTGTGDGGAVILGTDELTFTQFTGAQGFTAGAGLTSSGNAINVATASNDRIAINTDSIDLATITVTNNTVSNTKTIVTSVVVDSYGRVTSVSNASIDFNDVALTGNAVAPTASSGTNTTAIATTAFAIGEITDRAILKTAANAKGDIFTATTNDTPAILSVGTDGQRLVANSTATTGLSWAAHDLDSLSDVVISSASNNQFLRYNGSAWINSAVVEIVNINDLADVTLTSAATNQVLLYNGSAWVNTSNPTIAGNLTVSGNLTVTGTNTVINTSELHVADNVIILNNDVAGTPSENAGVEIERGTSTNVVFRWNETSDRWEFTNDGTYYQTIYIDTVTNAQAAAYTLALADNGKMIEMSVGSANALTVPSNANVAFPVGTTLTVLQTGSGQTTLTPQAGVTINGTPGLKLRAQWSSATLIKRASDTWVALGDLAA
jgi:hypothetical protein